MATVPRKAIRLITNSPICREVDPSLLLRQVGLRSIVISSRRCLETAGSTWCGPWTTHRLSAASDESSEWAKSYAHDPDRATRRVREERLTMTIVITAWDRSPDGGMGLARDMRVRWALEEVGQPYEVRLVSLRAKTEAAHLRLHPFGLIPTYEERDL